MPQIRDFTKNISNVFVLRQPDDAIAIRNVSRDMKNAIIIGGGYIGLEIASSLRKKGHKIIVLEVAERLLARVASPELSNYFLNLKGSTRRSVRCSFLLWEESSKTIQVQD